MIAKLTVGKGNYGNIFHIAGRVETTNFINILERKTTAGHLWVTVRVKFRQATWPWNSHIGKQKWRQVTQIWAKNCNIDREKSKYNSNMVSFSVHKIIGFEIQTRDISNPLKRSSCINLGKGGSTVKGYKGICTQCIWSRIGYNLWGID